MAKRDWNHPEDIPPAFDDTLRNAAKDATGELAKELLNKATAKSALAREGDITIPNEVEIIFYRQEDLPFRVVMAIPTKQTEPSVQPLQPTFEDCFLCTYDTYVHAADAAKLSKILRAKLTQ
jgi:hypothetical protein